MTDLNRNYGEIVQDIINEWDSIRTESQYNFWANKVKNIRLGTYENKTILDIFNSGIFTFKYINNVAKEAFKKELNNVFKTI